MEERKFFQFIPFQTTFKEVDLGYWASRTVGFSGADLTNLMNESAVTVQEMNPN